MATERPLGSPVMSLDEAQRKPNAANRGLAGPANRWDRIVPIDVLRGFALLGILVMNIQSFAMPDAAYLNPTAYGDFTGANRVVWVLGHLLADEKMFGIFSMLFGAGIVLMSDRISRFGAIAGPVHYRRMGWLMLFGLLHGHMLWSGDILWLYGLGGLVAFLFRNQSPRVLLASALAIFTIRSALYLMLGRFIQTLPAETLDAFTTGYWRPTAEMIQGEIATFGHGGWAQQMSLRSSEALFMETAGGIILLGWKALGNMLVGMALFKSGVLSGERSRTVYVRMMAVGFLVGLPMVAFGIWRNVVAGWDVRYSFFFGSQYNYWGAIIVDMGWIGAVVLACRPTRLERLTSTLAAVGRTAFSNYILQTIICTTLFYGHGFGLFGTVSRVGQFLIVIAVWVLLLVVSPLWLRYFAYGPLEWLWRSLTYGRRMPFVRSVAA